VLLGKRRQFDVKWRSIPLGDIGGRCNPSLIDATAKLSSGRSYGANKLFPNCGGRVANPFDCARQLIFGNAKMPGPIFNMVLTLDNDFAAVRSCFTDHLFCAPGYAESKQGRVGFVPLDGLDGQSTVQAWAQRAQAQGDRRLINLKAAKALGLDVPLLLQNAPTTLSSKRREVRYWHLADIQSSYGNVRFWG
jgi:hypothetical protein